MKKGEYIKEFKVRMDQIKCEKYKTFQPELPTKKFLFSGEKKSIHNMKLLCDDSSDQNKSTTADDEIEETMHVEETPQNNNVTKQQPEVFKEKKKKKEEVHKAVTGMFRDNIRRIDLVLVVEDDVDELINNMKMDFLSYIVRAGLEVEIEPGVMKNHRNLTFIKIHAPDPVLEKYGKFFGTKRYFADTRYHYMNKTKKYDKEWVMLVRNNYNSTNGFSNYERSIIVYKILLHLSFGDHANDYGIEGLLNKKVIVDVFALHDGPYFITPDQTISGSNGRQILNYYWSRIQNLFQQQPIHLIHEYFGPTLAFYFAFYEFFIKALKVAALVGIFNIILGTWNLTVSEKAVKKSICKSSINICKFCSSIICPQRPCKDYCLSVKIHLILDHLLIPLYSILTVIGAFIFLRLWQRREYFLKWMWEVGRHDSYYKNAVRPLFNRYGFGFCSRTDPFIGGLKYRENFIPILFRNVISKIIVISYWYYIIPIMYFTHPLYQSFCKGMRAEKHYEKYRDYITMSMFQAFNTLFITLLEKIYHHIIYLLVKIENHSSHRKFEESIAIKKIGFKMVCQYAFIAYYAWIYGNQVRYGRCYLVFKSSIYATYLYLMYTVYGYRNHEICDKHSFCFPYSCIIEVATLLATLLVVTQVIYKLYDYIYSLKTDYNQSVYGNSDIPCWEREYRLSSVTEEHMIQKYVDLVAQFSLVTWFVISFPLAPSILYLINIWDIRHQARKLVLSSRRPLLIKAPGTKFIKAFYFIALFSVLTNAINLTTVTRSVWRYVMFKLGKQPSDLFDFAIHSYEYGCSAPGLLYKVKYGIHFYDLKKPTFYRHDFYLVLFFAFYHFILFVFATGCAFIIIRYTISRQREVEVARKTEEKVRNLYYYYEHEYKYSKDR